MTVEQDLIRLLRGPTIVMLAFNGPVCGLSYSPGDVAVEARELLAADGIDPPAELLSATNPWDVWRWTVDSGVATPRIETMVRTAEAAAVRAAEPTPYVREVIVAAGEARKEILVLGDGISVDAMNDHLDTHRLDRHVAGVAERTGHHGIVWETRRHWTDPAESVLVASSPPDIEAGRAAGAGVVAYSGAADDADRYAADRYAAAGADVTLTSLAPLAMALMALRP